ncbi:MAG TPA: DnaJ domain-containing protein [Candidatus Saccharimonadales bacterium]|nr:DnaJ domain-containing protein [Candidatus Saccharimonadales bacterium]
MTGRSDHYAALGLKRDATRTEIRRAFRALALELHPDTNREDPEAARRFGRIARAYEVLGDLERRRAYDARSSSGRFAAPGSGGPSSYQVEDAGPVYHSDLGHHSDFYQSGDPLSVTEAAALVGRDAGWLRRAIREQRLSATKGAGGYLLRRRDVERLDRTAPRRRPRSEGPR